MPNHCSNYLTIKGSVELVKQFDDQFKAKHMEYSGGSTSCEIEKFNPDDYEEYICYKRTPYDNYFATEEDKNNRCSINYITNEDEVVGYSFNNFKEMTKDNFLDGWYEWSNSNWGTKWDCYDMMEETTELNKKYADNNLTDDCSAHYSFQTAWSPAIPVILEMSKQYPTMIFEFSAEECGCGYAGVYEILGGTIIKSEEAGDDNYREFMQEHFETEYYTCKKCGALLEEWEIEDNDNKCSECNECDEFTAPDGTEVNFNA